MDLKEFARQLSEATENMTPEQRRQVREMFAKGFRPIRKKKLQYVALKQKKLIYQTD